MKFSWKVFFSTLIIVMVVFGVGGYLLISSQFTKSLDREVSAAVNSNQLLCSIFKSTIDLLPAGSSLDDASVAEAVSTFSTSRTLQQDSLRIYDDKQRLIAQSTGAAAPAVGSSDDKNVPATPKTNDLLNKTTESRTAYSLREAGGSHLVVVSQKVVFGERALYLETLRDIEGIYRDRDAGVSLYQRLLLGMTVTIGILLFLLLLWLTRPIRDLSKTATKIAGGDLELRAEVTSNDEIGALTCDFNAMADSLENKIHELETIARQREEFVASFAHELKTPLTSIIGYSDLLRSQRIEGPDHFKAATHIYTEGRRLESLASKLLDLIVLNKTRFEMMPMTIKTLFDRVESATREKLASDGLRLELNYDPATVMIEPDLFEALLINLIDNARKASTAGSVIELTGRLLRSDDARVREGEGKDADPASEYYEILVTDYGTGIPHDELDRITEAFYRVDKSRAREAAGGGSGLGLSIASEIATVHDTTLDIESEVARGTTARILLKVAGT